MMERSVQTNPQRSAETQGQKSGESRIKAIHAGRIPPDGGIALLIGTRQIAVFHYLQTNQYFACDNECPHNNEMVLARGIIGDKGGVPFVACPMHKRAFSLETGDCLNKDCGSVRTYPVAIEDDFLYIHIDEDIENSDEQKREPALPSDG